MLKIAVCDDSKIQCDYTIKEIDSKLAGTPHLISGYNSAAELLDAVSGGDFRPDIAVLDVEMPKIDGINLAKELNALVPSCQIIFLTAYLGYATDVYSTQHVYFILKSELKTRIDDALKKAMVSLEKADASEPALLLRMRTTSVVVMLSSIKYIERLGRKTHVVTKDSVLQTAQPPKELLCDGRENYFIHCHQSYWVNKSSISSLEHDTFRLHDGELIPISRSLRQSARDAFFEVIKSR